MVEDVLGTLPGDEGATTLAPGRADDPQAVGPAQLESGDPDAAAGSVDEERLTRHRAGLVVQGARCRRIVHSNRGALGERERGGQRVDQVGVAGDQFRVAAVEHPGVPTRGVYAVADLDSLHVLADGLDDAGGVAAGNVGHGGHVGVSSGPDVGVHWVDPSGADPQEHLSWPDLRIRRVLVLQDVGVAWLVHADGFHARLLKASAGQTGALAG